jgi:hypothetical protein
MVSSPASYIARKYGLKPYLDPKKYYNFPWKNIFGEEGVGYVVPEKGTGFDIKINWETLPEFSYNLVDSTNIGMCVFAPITFGMTMHPKDPVQKSIIQVIPPEEEQFVHHALTPALNLGKMKKMPLLEGRLEKLHNVSRAILHAAYIGALLTAATFKSDKVFLTLVGGSAFRTPMSFIAEAINYAFDCGYFNYVKEVILVFYPAREKWIKDTDPLRSPLIDTDFFASLKPIARDKDLLGKLEEYTDLMYGERGGALPVDNVNKASRLAAHINVHKRN